MYKYLTDQGVVIADTQDTRAMVESEYRNAFGQDLVTTPETPQGLLITAETLARDEVIRNNAALANQINPNLAGGVFLDAIMALTNSKRDPAERSTVSCTLTGVNGAIVPEGSIIATQEGVEFSLISTVILNGGTATGQFQSVEFGAIEAPANSLTEIVTGVLGWETVNNTSSATLGRAVQSDQSARLKRKNTLAVQGSQTAESIISGLYSVDNVKSLQFRENVTSANATIDGQTLLPHSIWLCVEGGTDQAVASMILRKKSAGANYNGNVIIGLKEPFSGQQFDVKFFRPTLIPVQVRVTIKNVNVADPITAVKDSIIAYANGELEGEVGFGVGINVSPYELGGAINKLNPALFVSKVEVSLVSPLSWTMNEIVIAINQKATIVASSIEVIIT
jgi:hypothetical protein